MADGKNIGVVIAREIKEIERKKLKAVKKGDYGEASRLCNSAGELLSTSGFFAEAIEWHKEEVNYSEVANDILGLAIGNRKIGECFCELCEFDEAIEHQKQHLKLSQSIDNNVEEQRALATLGRTLFVMSDSMGTEFEQENCLKESLHYYLKSFAVSNKLREQVSSEEIHEMRARLCLNIGLVYEWKNQLDQAEKYMEKALISSRENDLKDNMYRCYLSLSGVTAKNKKFQESLRLAKRAQHLAKEKGDKSMEADAVLQLGQIFMKLGSFSSAVKLIRQSYKLHVPTLENDRESLLENLKLAIKGERCSQQLNIDLDDEERLKLVEKLGDIFSEAKSAEKALHYYQKQLELCEKLEKGSRAIAAVYISLAITHAENGDVEKALEFYRKELKLREDAGFDCDFKEMTATHSAIAKLLEDSNSGEKSVEEAYAKAIEFAEKSGSASCLLHVYKEMRQSLQKYGKLEETAAIEKKIESLENVYDDTEEDSQGVKEENEEEDIEELLHASDSSEEETRTAKNARLAKKKANKVNEKGETPLHVACIGGNIEKAKDLLERGASVHNRDFCGWQPLHEACNFGHTEIVKLLLLFGADVNDPGGDHCGNVTPLHDSSQNGHIETVKLLISRGANPLARDAKGRSPLDLVQAAIKADEEELEGSESDVLESRKKVRAYLREVVLKSRPEPQLRNRSVLDQFADEDAKSSEDEMDYQRKLNTKGIENTDSDEESLDNRIIDRRSKGSRNAANFQIEDDSESFPAVGFEKVNPCIQSSGDRVSATDEAFRRDEDSTYESMDEDTNSIYSPMKPLDALANNETRSLGPVWESAKLNGPSVETVNPIGSQTNNGHRPPNLLDTEMQAQMESEYNPDVDSVAPFTSESDASDVELVDGFIVDDVGQSQARKKRRLEGFPRKRSIQQKIAVPGQSSSGVHTRRKVSERGSQSRLSLSKPRNKRQSRLTHFQTGANLSQSAQAYRQTAHRHRFTVNNGACRGSDLANENGPNNQDFDQSFNQAARQIGTEERDDIRNSQVSSNLAARGSIRVRVRVENELLLIPCIDSSERKTIKWLADQASQRYSSSTGLTPCLSLKTKEGALLSNQDFVTDVLMTNEEVTAQITGWNSGSICEKYGTECSVLGINARPDIIDVFALENDLCNLHLADFNVKNSHLIAIGRSIAGHSKLSKIDLTGNFLGDNGIECLCCSIRYLPSLVSLNLSCTGMTSVGLSHLSISLGIELRVRTVPGYDLDSPLEDLNCSYNAFDDPLSVSKSLVAVLKTCTKLSCLKLEHCFLPKELFSNEYKFSKALKECKSLVTLLLGGNHFQSMHTVFCAIPETLQEINLSSCFAVDNGLLQGNNYNINLNQLKSLNMQNVSELKILHRIIKNESVVQNLEILDFSNSDVDKESIIDILSTISRFKSLKELNISCIEAVDEQVACELMKTLVSSSSVISILKMTSCSINSLPDVFTQCCVNCQTLSYVDLSFNNLHWNDKQRLSTAWKERFQHGVSIVDNSFCIHSVENYSSF